MSIINLVTCQVTVLWLESRIQIRDSSPRFESEMIRSMNSSLLLEHEECLKKRKSHPASQIVVQGTGRCVDYMKKKFTTFSFWSKIRFELVDRIFSGSNRELKSWTLILDSSLNKLILEFTGSKQESRLTQVKPYSAQR